MTRYIAAVTRIDEDEMMKIIEMVRNDPRGEMMNRFTEKWIEEGLEQGLEQGQQQGLRDSILESLHVRFDVAPTVIAEKLSAIEDKEALRTLLRQAITADSLATFEQFLASLTLPQ